MSFIICGNSIKTLIAIINGLAQSMHKLEAVSELVYFGRLGDCANLRMSSASSLQTIRSCVAGISIEEGLADCGFMTSLNSPGEKGAILAGSPH